MGDHLYTPAIKPDLLRGLHRLSQVTHLPMTRLLDAVLRHELRKVKERCGPDICRACRLKSLNLDGEASACRYCAFGPGRHLQHRSLDSSGVEEARKGGGPWQGR